MWVPYSSLKPFLFYFSFFCFTLDWWFSRQQETWNLPFFPLSHHGWTWHLSFSWYNLLFGDTFFRLLAKGVWKILFFFFFFETLGDWKCPLTGDWYLGSVISMKIIPLWKRFRRHHFAVFQLSVLLLRRKMPFQSFSLETFSIFTLSLSSDIL